MYQKDERMITEKLIGKKKGKKLIGKRKCSKVISI